MTEATVAGEWISVWLSPLGYFVLDVLLAVLTFAATAFFLSFVRRLRHKNTHSVS